MGAPTMTGADPARRLRRRRWALSVGIWAALVVVLGVLAIFIPLWWAPVPLLSLVGLVSWRRNILWAGLVGWVVGFLFWSAQLWILPGAPAGRLAAALAGAEGLTPTEVFYLGPILFGVITLFAAMAATGLLRVLTIEVAPSKGKAGGTLGIQRDG